MTHPCLLRIIDPLDIAVDLADTDDGEEDAESSGDASEICDLDQASIAEDFEKAATKAESVAVLEESDNHLVLCGNMLQWFLFLVSQMAEKHPLQRQRRGDPISLMWTTLGNGRSSHFVQASRREKKEKSRGYEEHTLPTGATPVPEDTNGVRAVGDWNFSYDC